MSCKKLKYEMERITKKQKKRTNNENKKVILI